MDLQLKSVIKVQNKFREIKNQLGTINSDMSRVKDYINNQMMTLQYNYDIDLITKEKYIERMEKLDNLFCDFIKLPLIPVSMYSLKDMSIIEMQVKISNLLNKLRELCKNNGMRRISQITNLFLGINWIHSISNKCFNMLVFFDKYVIG